MIIYLYFIAATWRTAMFAEVMRWTPDDKPKSTEAVVLVSKDGVVKRMAYRHWNEKNQGYSLRKEHVYPQHSGRGKGRRLPGNYMTVSIRGKDYSVHRLVAIAWIPNPDNLPQVNHKDGDKQNNTVENLEWVTNLENMSHARRHGLFPENPRGDPHGMSKLQEWQVREIKRDLKSYRRGLLTELGKKYGVLKTTISEIRAGRTWAHVL